jgi:NAD(P)-dependent dehydrogenase (short-subunit alcohol dehydrogenase family)
MPSVLITGASRGIGLELTKRYAERGWTVFATCRDPGSAHALQQIAHNAGHVSLRAMDVTDHASVDALAEAMQGVPVDVLINNAGIGRPFMDIATGMDYDHWRRVMETNLYAPMKIALAFLPNVEASAEKKIVSVSSTLGCITRAYGGPFGGGGNYAYRSSKAALNMAMRALAHDLKPRGVICTLLSPGLVDTDFIKGSGQKGIPVQDSVEGLLGVIDALTIADTAKWIRYSREEVPW